MTDVEAEADRILAWSQKLLDEAVELSPHRKAEAPVSIQPSSSNRKLAPQRLIDVNGRKRCVPIGPFVTSTYVSIEATCPSSCPFRGNGCYAQAGMAVSRLDRVAVRKRWSGDATIEAEVKALDGVFVRGVPQDGARGGRDLRLHVSGDAHNTAGAKALAAAAERWKQRGGGAVWTFTHLWRTIPRAAWGPIAVLASVETRRDVEFAMRRGYPPALTVPEFSDDGAFPAAHGIRAVPCPAQTRGKTCVECRLCLDPELASRRSGVAFAVHGKQAESARNKLRVIQ